MLSILTPKLSCPIMIPSVYIHHSHNRIPVLMQWVSIECPITQDTVHLLDVLALLLLDVILVMPTASNSVSVITCMLCAYPSHPHSDSSYRYEVLRTGLTGCLTHNSNAGVIA